MVTIRTIITIIIIYNIIDNNMSMYNAPNEIQGTDRRIRQPKI